MPRTKTFAQFTNAVKSLLALENIQTDEIGWIKYSLNSSFEEARDAALWPDIVLIEERTPVSARIDYEDGEKTEIGKVYNVYDYSPHDTSHAASKITFGLDATGIILNEVITGNVFVEFSPAYDELDDEDIEDLLIPKPLFNYCVYSAIADYRFGRGEIEMYNIAENKAQAKLINQKLSLLKDQRQGRNLSVRTQTTEQSR